MQNVQFLNIEYILVYLFSKLGGIDISDIPYRLQSLFATLENIGILASLILLAMLIYAHMRFEQVMEQAHHMRLEAEEAAAHRDVQKTPTRFDHVMELMTSGHASDWRQAILEADIMLGETLTEAGLPGEGIGEQLKNAPRGTAWLDLAWEAHRVRNEIAHAGSSFELTEREAKRTVDLYRRVFEATGVLSN